MNARLFVNDLKPRIARAREEDGQSLVEYALILMLVALAVVGTLGMLGTVVNNALNAVLAGF